jgi:CheY-like chemotaxis protein
MRQMDSLDVLVIGPTNSDRTQLEDTIKSLGHTVVAAEPLEGAALAATGMHDVVLIDGREPGADWRPLADLAGDSRPLLVVADQPRRLLTSLGGRPAGAMVLTGGEGPAGYRVALRLCAALRRQAAGMGAPA